MAEEPGSFYPDRNVAPNAQEYVLETHTGEIRYIIIANDPEHETLQGPIVTGAISSAYEAGGEKLVGQVLNALSAIARNAE